MKHKILNEFENGLAQLAVVIMLIILMVQVIGRYLFGYAPTWIEEAARYLFVWTTYAAACNGVYHNAHLKIDAAIKLYPKCIRPYVKYIGNLIFFIYAVAVGVFGVEFCQGIFKAQQISASLHIKMGYVYSVIPIFHFLMAVRIVQLTIKMIRHPDEYTPEAELEAQIESETGKAGEN